MRRSVRAAARNTRAQNCCPPVPLHSSFRSVLASSPGPAGSPDGRADPHPRAERIAFSDSCCHLCHVH